MKNLTDQYRPVKLADLFGQSLVRRELEKFVAAPHSAAFLFEGPTGVGKTSAALALANELGCHPTSGIWQYNGTDLDEDAMDQLQSELRFAPMGGGWRVVIVDEADYFVRAPKIYTRWNSLLESEPTRTVFVFTTNHADKFSSRFLDRTERLPFAGENGPILLVDAQELVDYIWAREGRGTSPRVTELPGILDVDGAMSFRRVVRALEPLLRPAPEFRLESRSDAPVSLFQAALNRSRLGQPQTREVGSVGKAGRSATMFA